MSIELHKQSIGRGKNARQAEQEPLMEPARESGSEAVSGITTARGIHGFTLSARVGRPFRFEPGAPTAPGEAKPITTKPETQVSGSNIEIRKSTKPHYEKLTNDTACLKESASENTVRPIFAAIPGFLFRTLFRRRTDRSHREF